MCGIFGLSSFQSVVDKLAVLDTLVNGLERMKYRGYDSSGIVMISDSGTFHERVVGDEENALKNAMQNALLKSTSPVSKFEPFIGIGHTRWATHGKPEVRNAHPIKSDVDGQFFVVHNGMINNADALKAHLQSLGHVFVSDTDTEIAAKLVLEEYLKDGTRTFAELCKAAVDQVQGQYAFIFVSKHFPGQMIAMNNGSPLIVGIVTKHRKVSKSYDLNDSEAPQLTYDSDKKAVVWNAIEDSSVLFSSDQQAIFHLTRDIIHINKGEIVAVDKEKVVIYTSKEGKAIEIFKKDIDLTTEVKKGSYMIKEIYDQKTVVMNVLKDRINLETGEIYLPQLDEFKEQLVNARDYTFIGCGTSFNSCKAIETIFQELTDKKVSVHFATSFVDAKTRVVKGDIIFFVSQSGETKDVLDALNYCKNRGAICIGLTNVPSSQIAKNTVCGLNIRAGSERSVASTKAYSCQIMNFILIALYIGKAIEEKGALVDVDKENTRNDTGDNKAKDVTNGVGSGVHGSELLNGSDLLNGNGIHDTELLKSNTAGETHEESIQHSLSRKERIQQIINELRIFQDKIDEALSVEVDQFVDKLSEKNSIIIAGRGFQYATSLESALKIKEVSYIHAESTPAGELKHGPLALVSEDINVIVLISNDELKEAMYNTYKQIKSRLNENAPLVVTTPSLAHMFETEPLIVPETIDCLQCILNVFPMQKLAYRLAIARNVKNPDQPRNLAKSVTVS